MDLLVLLACKCQYVEFILGSVYGHSKQQQQQLRRELLSQFNRIRERIVWQEGISGGGGKVTTLTLNKSQSGRWFTDKIDGLNLIGLQED